ncbi:Brp/Blh family beta-carotene 15,15'-dioxygenase [Sphingorhabdus sp.]|jgi:Brp/Blh family beta-carotene 15,15'-monooxygenase|uniref:Brp/Blh family beta-carotene 15,15'-dioxygenase n=1 Tax=Sphingorhabdus sp. TaxID=1902408 RepID=UPI0037C782F8
MTTILYPNSAGAAFSKMLRLFALPVATLLLVIIDRFWGGMNSPHVNMLAAVAIVLAGIPHGTLDVEIAAAHFGQKGITGKIRIIGGYLLCAAAMVLLWILLPELALISFLIISIVHFSRDWRGGVDPFLAMMVGWALVALPALASPDDVAMIFAALTGSNNGAVIAALLGAASVPAALGSLVFAYWAFRHDDKKSALEVLACIVAALFLPPLVAFAIFFCGLHSPRHMADALRETGDLSPLKKTAIICAVFALSLGLGVVMFLYQGDVPADMGIIRTAFILISTLTVPHFILEHILSDKNPA